MVAIKVFFQIIDHFRLMDEEDYNRNLEKAEKEYASIRIPKDKEANTDSEGEKVPEYKGFKKIIQWIKIQENDSWIVSVLISISSIFIIKWINEFMEPSNPIDEFRSDLQRR